MECEWEDYFFLPERKFPRENEISWKVVQNSQTEFPNGKCAFHLQHFLRHLEHQLVPGSLYNLRNSFVNGTSASLWKFPIWKDIVLTRPIYKNRRPTGFSK